MNTIKLNASSRILIVSPRYNNTGFLGGLNSILNQLLYAEEFGFIPVVYFDPWSDDFPDFNRQELFRNDLWQQYFESLCHYGYEDILQLIASPNHPLTKRNLHYLSNEEMLYLDYGKPESIFSGYNGYYRFYQGDHHEWLTAQRKKAQALITRYIKVRPDINEKIEAHIEVLASDSPLLGVVVDNFERPEADNGLQLNLKPYFRFIDEYVGKNPQCSILLVSGNKKYIRGFQRRYSDRIKLIDNRSSDKFKQFNDLLSLSKCDFLLKDHSELGEFVLYLNPGLAYKDIRDQLRPQSRIVKSLKGFTRELSLFRKRWSSTAEHEGLSIKTLARLVILANPITQITIKGLEKHRYSRYMVLRFSVLFIDFVKLLRARSYYPLTRIKHRAFHASKNINSEFYNFEVAPQKKYIEIRNTWDTNTGFFAYFMMALTQLKFAETHGLKPVVNFNEPHNHFFEPGHSSNIWENYFEPVTDLNSEDLQSLDPKELTFLDHQYHLRPGGYKDPEKNDALSTKIWLETHRAMRAALTKKHIRPKAFIVEMVDDYYRQFMSGQHVLGIHIRGTDKDVDQKGKRYVAQETLVRKIEPGEYFPYVDKFLSVHTGAKVFVATDQQQYLDNFIERYGERVITSAAMRTTGEEPLFRQKKSNKYHRGVEVLCDSLLLSRCDFLIKGWSNVGEAAICFNPSIPVVDIMYLPNIKEIDFSKSQPAVPEDLLELHQCLIGYESKNQSHTF